MIKSGIDHEAMVTMFSQATAKQATQALVSGVLIGMSEGLRQGAAPAATGGPSSKR